MIMNKTPIEINCQICLYFFTFFLIQGSQHVGICRQISNDGQCDGIKITFSLFPRVKCSILSAISWWFDQMHIWHQEVFMTTENFSSPGLVPSNFIRTEWPFFFSMCRCQIIIFTVSPLYFPNLSNKTWQLWQKFATRKESC